MYRKPLIIKLNNIAEGVYAESGDWATGLPEGDHIPSQPANTPLYMVNSWPGGKQYDAVFTNDSNEVVHSLTFVAHIVGDVTAIYGNPSISINGDTVEFTMENPYEGYAPQQTITVWVQVNGNGDFYLEA